jgi:hypothetical protein
MSILNATALKLLHLPAIRLPKWPRFTLGKQVSDTTEVYAQATSLAYTTALGFTSNSRAAKERDY